MNKKEVSRLSIAGLVLAVLTPAILCLNFPLTTIDIPRFYYAQNEFINFITNCLAIALPVMALHLSMAGVKRAKKQEKRGVVPGVIGIVISSLEILAYIVVYFIYNVMLIFPKVY